MIFLYDGHEPEQSIAVEMGCEVGRLYSPLTRYSADRAASVRFAVDNGAFSEIPGERFRSLLERLSPHKDNCLFVAVPDIVGSARRTLEVFQNYRLPNWPLALVAQDGIEDLDIPWNRCQAIFIGGTDKFKRSESAVQVVKAAKILGKWTHIGRVNTPERWDRYEEAGADSCDGTGLTRYSHMRQAIAGRMPMFAEVVNGDSAE